MEVLLDFLYQYHILSLWYYVSNFIIVLTVIVFIHEFGHYIVAKWCGVKIESFSIGFGPELVGFNDRSGTRWKISAIPMGGYVKMFGDVDPASSPDFDKLKSLTEDEKKTTFYTKKLWQKALVVAAGPLANYILAIVILTCFYFSYGRPFYEPIVGGLVENMPADQAGLEPGDRLLQIDGTDIESFSDIVAKISLNTGTEIDVTYERDDKEYQTVLIPKVIEKENVLGGKENIAVVGIYRPNKSYKNMDYGVFEAVWISTKDSIHYSAQMLRAIGQIIVGDRSVKDLGGPIKIAKYSGEAAKIGFQMVIWLMAMISISLGLFNLFPIPVLDGGHLLFYTIEAFQGRPLAEKIQDYTMKVGMTLILLLAAIVTFNDIKTVILG